jgi:plasmid stability protein
MKSLHIRDIDEQTLECLKRLARSHQRSLQGELRAILLKAARMAPPDQGNNELELITVKTGGEATWNRTEIYGNHSR